MGRIRIRIREIAGVNVHQLDHPVGIGAGGRDVQRGFERPGECEVFLQRFGFIHQHVRTCRGEALIVDRIRPRVVGRDLHRERHRFGGVADVFVEGVGAIARRVECQRATHAEIKRALRGLLWRPGVEAAPLVRSRLENLRLGRGVVRVALQEMAEERQFDLLAVELRRLRVKVDVTQLVAFFAAPIAVRPRAHHQHVGDSGVLPFSPAIGLQRAEQILPVEPAADGHNGAADILQVRPDVPGLPVRVVSRVGEELIPDGRPAFEVNRIRVRKRPHPQVEVVAVGRPEVETLQLFVQGVINLLGEPVEEVEVLRQEEGAVVVDVIAHEPVRDRRLRRRRFQGGVRVDHAHRGVETGIGNAEHPDISIVVRNVFDQPINRVPGVGVFVRVLRALIRVERTHVDVFALRTKAPAHVLRDEDETVGRQRAKGP